MHLFDAIVALRCVTFAARGIIGNHHKIYLHQVRLTSDVLRPFIHDRVATRQTSLVKELVCLLCSLVSERVLGFFADVSRLHQLVEILLVTLLPCIFNLLQHIEYIIIILMN